MSDRPTCGTCPHRMQDTEDCVYRCFANGPRSIMVMSDDPGCRHHPDMGAWLAQRQTHSAQPQPDRQQRAAYKPPARSLADELASVKVVREWLAALPFPPQGETLAERLANLSAEWTRYKSAPPVADQLAELEQWRKALVWRKFDNYGWSLQVAKIGFGEAYVSSDGDGLWFVGRRKSEFYRTRDAAMRGAEQALGLPKCRVEVEP